MSARQYPVRYRVGRKVGRTIYEQRGPEPSDRDRLVGVMDTAGLAADAVSGLNRASELLHAAYLESYAAAHGECPVCGKADVALGSRGRLRKHLAPLYRDVQRWDDPRLPADGPKLAVRCYGTGRRAA